MLCETEYEDDFEDDVENEEKSHMSPQCSTQTSSRSASTSHYEGYDSSVVSPDAKKQSSSYIKLNVKKLSDAVFDNAQLIHNSKITSVALVEPDTENKVDYKSDTITQVLDKTDELISDVCDPYSKTKAPSCAGRHRAASSSSTSSSMLQLRTADLSSLSSPISTSTVTSSTLSTRKEKGKKKGFVPLDNIQNKYKAAKNSNNISSDKLKPFSVSKKMTNVTIDNVHVWKRHSLMSYRERGKQGVPRCLIKRCAIPTTPQVQNSSVKNFNDEMVSLSPSPLPSSSPAVSGKVVVTNRLPLCGNGRENAHGGKFLNSRSESSTSQDTELQKKILCVKKHLETLRHRRETLERLSKKRLRADKKSPMRNYAAGFSRIEDENDYFRRLLKLQDEGKRGIELLVAIKEEELKYAEEKLKQIKLQLREIKTNNRRASIMFFKITKQQTTAREQVDRQQREGMYNRLQLLMKARKLQEEIEAMRETSVHFSKRIHQLENRVKAEGLSEMKIEDYTALQREIKKRSKLINRLATSVAAMQNKKEFQTKEKAEDNTFCDIDFPGREEMEGVLRKLLMEVKAKDEQIAACRVKINITKEQEAQSKIKKEENKENKEVVDEQKRTRALSIDVKGDEQNSLAHISQPPSYLNCSQTPNSYSLTKPLQPEKQEKCDKSKGENEVVLESTKQEEKQKKNKNENEKDYNGNVGRSFVKECDMTPEQNYTMKVFPTQEFNNSVATETLKDSFTPDSNVIRSNSEQSSGVKSMRINDAWPNIDVEPILSIGCMSNTMSSASLRQSSGLKKKLTFMLNDDKSSPGKTDEIEPNFVENKVKYEENDKKLEEMLGSGSPERSKIQGNTPIWLLDE